MKPIIVTYSNKSYPLESEYFICFAPPARVIGHTQYYCSEIIKGVFSDNIRCFTIPESDIKLIARPKK